MTSRPDFGFGPVDVQRVVVAMSEGILIWHCIIEIKLPF
jgi:hypothetical protein